MTHYKVEFNEFTVELITNLNINQARSFAIKRWQVNRTDYPYIHERGEISQKGVEELRRLCDRPGSCSRVRVILN